MKSSSNRGSFDNDRPRVRSVGNPGYTQRTPADLSRSANPNYGSNTGAGQAYGAGQGYGAGPIPGVTEEPYHDMNQGGGNSPVEEPFDYSLMGRPNSSAVVKRKPSSGSRPARKPSSSSSAARPTHIKSTTVKKKKGHSKSSKGGKNSSGKGMRVLAIVASILAVSAAVIGILYAFGVFKPRIEVVMADGTIQKIKAEDAYLELTDGNRYYDGTIVNDINIGGMTREEAMAAITAGLEAAPLDVNIDLKVQEQIYDLDLSSLALTVNTDEILTEAYALNRPTDPEDFEQLKICYNAYQAMKNTPVKYQTAYTCATDGLNNLVHGVLVPLELSAQDARITDFDKDNNVFIVEPEAAGFDVDIDKAVTDVTDLLENRIYEGVVEVDSTEIEPELTEAYITENFGKISSCSSTTSNTASRNNNINQACKYIDGTMLMPGEVFSFNDVVGMRTEARGFQEATVITGGKYEQGMGGGICQVSTMVYGAAVKANLHIVNRSSHAWPSGYVSAGLDATVDWGSIDFKFENDTEYPIVVRAHYADKNVSVSIYGHKLPDGQRIEFIAESQTTTPAGATEYVADPNAPVGQTTTVRNAHDGIRAVSYQVWYDANGNEIRREQVATTNYKMYVKKVEVGTKMPDGSHAQFDASTGKVITPTPTPSPTPAPATPTPTPVPATPTPVPDDPADPPEDQGGGE
ncbi:MAG: VanW family protein [Clostridiales bacterium]|nr:VanW family protein [Clostridiales bacterium]